MNTMQTRDLCKSYGPVEVLKNINIGMEFGDFLVLVGPSGCGKSTLLNCIAGLEEITQGGLHIGGRDVTQVPPKDRDIAMVFQSYALYPTMTVAQNIGFGMKIRRIPKPEIAKKVAEVAELLQIGPLLDRRPSQLSGGQRQRVAMGRALVRDPKLFLFDEPLSNLDAKLRVEMRAEIKALHQQTNASIVYVTHDQVEAMTLATKIVVLKDGIVQQIGTPEEIYDRPANMFVADFMGAPPMNLLPVDIKAQGSVMIGDVDLRASIPTSKQGKDLIVGIRPEHLALAGASQPDFTVTPDMIENTGSDSYVSFTLAGNTVTARVPGRISPNSGALGFVVDRSHVSLFDRTDGCRIDGQLQG